MSSAEIAERITALKLELQDYSQKIGKKPKMFSVKLRLITSLLLTLHNSFDY